MRYCAPSSAELSFGASWAYHLLIWLNSTCKIHLEEDGKRRLETFSVRSTRTLYSPPLGYPVHACGIFSRSGPSSPPHASAAHRLRVSRLNDTPFQSAGTFSRFRQISSRCELVISISGSSPFPELLFRRDLHSSFKRTQSNQNGVLSSGIRDIRKIYWGQYIGVWLVCTSFIINSLHSLKLILLSAIYIHGSCLSMASNGLARFDLLGS